MKILITGATGMIGTALCKKLLENSHHIHYLTTRKEEIKSEAGYQGFFWNPQEGMIDEDCFEGVEVIVHLAGANVAKKWTHPYKLEMFRSRIVGTRLLQRTLLKNRREVKRFITASAIGIYESSFERTYKEGDTHFDKSNFLGNLAYNWEATAEEFFDLDLEVCKMRTGLVLSKNGGMLQEMLKPARWGMSAAFATGKQWQSWIHIEDLVGMYVAAIEQSWDGAFNAVAPNPVTNKQMVAALAKKIKRPYFLPGIPKFVLKIIFGEMHEILISSQKVVPNRALKMAFQFKFHTLSEALDDLLKE